MIGMAKMMRKTYYIVVRHKIGNIIVKGRVTNKLSPEAGIDGVEFVAENGGWEGNICVDGTLQVYDTCAIYPLTGRGYTFKWYAEEDPDIGYPTHF